MKIIFIKDRTNARALDIYQIGNTVTVRINPALYKINSSTIELHKLFYYGGLNATVIRASIKSIKDLAANRNLLRTSINC